MANFSAHRVTKPLTLPVLVALIEEALKHDRMSIEFAEELLRQAVPFLHELRRFERLPAHV